MQTNVSSAVIVLSRIVHRTTREVTVSKDLPGRNERHEKEKKHSINLFFL